MRLATTASIAVLALSTAALAQVNTQTPDRMGNNTIVGNTGAPGNTMMPPPAPMPGDTTGTMADNIMDNSAAPPPREPR